MFVYSFIAARVVSLEMYVTPWFTTDLLRNTTGDRDGVGRNRFLVANISTRCHKNHRVMPLQPEGPRYSSCQIPLSHSVRRPLSGSVVSAASRHPSIALSYIRRSPRFSCESIYDHCRWYDNVRFFLLGQRGLFPYVGEEVNEDTENEEHLFSLVIFSPMSSSHSRQHASRWMQCSRARFHWRVTTSWGMVFHGKLARVLECDTIYSRAWHDTQSGVQHSLKTLCARSAML